MTGARIVALILACAVSLTTAPARAAQPTAAERRPAIWLLEDADTKIYLFGSVHIIARSIRWTSPMLETIVLDADELMIEQVRTPSAPRQASPFARFQTDPALPLLDRLPPDLRPRVAAGFASSGVPQEAWSSFSIWGAALFLEAYGAGSPATETAPVAEMILMERVFRQLFRDRGKPVLGLEPATTVPDILNALPVDRQIAFLRETIDRLDADARSHDPEESDWSTGDVEGIARTASRTPQIAYELLMVGRNRNWATTLIDRLDRPGTVLVVVGAAHLAGPDSVQAILGARGFAVRRVQ